MRRAVALLTLVAVLAGCSHIRPSDPTSGGDIPAEVTRALAGREVEVKLSSGAELWAEHVNVGRDSTWFSVLGRPSHVRPWQVDVGRGVPNGSIGSISVRRHWRGALEGGAVGLLVGFAFGLLAGWKDTWFEPIDGGIVLGRAGLIAGVVYGGLSGSKDVYDFTRAPRDQR